MKLNGSRLKRSSQARHDLVGICAARRPLAGASVQFARASTRIRGSIIMKPKRPNAIAPLLLCLLIPFAAMSAPAGKEVEVNGVRLSYVEQGAGEPIVFVHGAFSDLRVWEPSREAIAKRYRFIAYTQRYHGVGAWKDEGKEYSAVTHADDLAKFITSFNAGPVHLVGRSGGGALALRVALKDPALVRTLTVHEPALMSVLPMDSEEGKAAREDQARVGSAARASISAGDPGVCPAGADRPGDVDARRVPDPRLPGRRGHRQADHDSDSGRPAR
jgi:pimeloyl-ACP methyl ester carboxylesterase